MSQVQVFEGNFEDIIAHHANSLHGRRVRITLETIENEPARPFYETATAEEWAQALRDWATHSRERVTLLPDEATRRESIYEGRG